MSDTGPANGIAQSRPKGFPLYLLGSSFILVGIVHAARDTSSVLFRGLELGVIATLAFALVAATRHIAGHVGRTQFGYVVASTVGLGLLTGALSLIASGIQLLQGYSLNEPLYYATIMGAGGAAIGPYIGYYYARLQRSNAELTDRYKETSRLNRRLNVVNRVLRHNLRNNLTVIDGVASDLQRRVDGNGTSERIALLNRRTNKLVQLSAKMSEIRQVWQTSERQPIDVVPLVQGMASEIESEYPAVTVRTNLPESATVMAHPKLEAALQEIFTNAVEHNDPAALTIEVTVDASGAGDYYWVEIADTGSGIPDIEQSLFAEVDPTESALEHGIGLGLWLLYWTVEKSDGEFSVTNDDGAVVTLRLPRATKRVDGKRATTEQPPLGKLSPSV